MNTAFTIHDMKDIDGSIKKIFLTYRTQSEKYTEKMNEVMENFWQNYFTEYTDYTFFINPEEVEEFSKNANFIKELQKRKNGCIILDGNIFPLKKLNYLLTKKHIFLEELVINNIKKIKGRPAYPGKIQGKVKKILSFSDMKKFKAGEILVTEMTNPKYLSIIKKTSAIITDEGGITCHAAIISRELKKPCITGTKNATKILNDGDIIEVDANRGVVHIIKKVDNKV